MIRALAGVGTRLLFGIVMITTIAGAIVSVSCDDDQWDALLAVRVLDHEFTALRRYEVRQEDGSYETQVLRVRSAGDRARFRISLQTLNGQTRAQMTPGSEEAARFDSLQAHYNAGGGYRLLYQVGFRVHDRELLCENYSLLQVDDPGIPIQELSIHFVAASNHPDRSHWRVDLSAESGREGFLIGFEEFQVIEGSRTVLSRMTTLELDYGQSGILGRPDDGPVLGREVLDDVAELVAQADIPIYYPSCLPAGFELIAVEVDEIRTDAGFGGKRRDITYYRLVFSDGIETFEIFQSKLTALSSSLLDELSGIPENVVNVVVEDFLTVRQWAVPGPSSEVVVEGRRSTERFVPLLQSLQRID